MSEDCVSQPPWAEVSRAKKQVVGAAARRDDDVYIVSKNTPHSL